MSGCSLGGLLAVGRVFIPRWGLDGRFAVGFFGLCLCRNAWRGRFLPLQAGCRVGAGSGSSYSLFQVPWSELKKFYGSAI